MGAGGLQNEGDQIKEWGNQHTKAKGHSEVFRIPNIFLLLTTTEL